MMGNLEDRALILDVSAILYRSFYSLANMKNSNGTPTGAVFGFLNTFNSLIEKFNPKYIVACFDVSRDSLKRREIFPEYKAHRDAMPEALVQQLKYIEPILESYGVQNCKVAGYEADDLVASASLSFLSKAIDPYVVTGDKDLLQLVDQGVKIVRLGKFSGEYKIFATVEEVEEYMGVLPGQIVDLFSIQGDASDGIPGVKGIGAKGAAKLIKAYEDLDGVYANIESLPEKMQEKLETDRENAYISKELATLAIVDLELTLQEYKGPDLEKLVPILAELEFKTLIKKLGVASKESVAFKYSKVLPDNLKEGISFLHSTEEGYAILFKKELYFVEELPLEQLGTVVTFNAKHLFKIYPINLEMDLMLGYHLLYPAERFNIKRIILKEFGDEIPEGIEGAVATVSYFEKLYAIILKKLESENMLKLYNEVEQPLISVLSAMEQKGVALDVSYLEKYKVELEKRIGELEETIQRIAGCSFNIASPKQLSELLFGEMGLTPIKKTKTGFSTDNEVLEALAKQGVEIATHLVEYRKLVKLENTYVSTLPQQVDQNNRLHTTFNQDGTATGRLSSSNPNLQNIPSRTSEGRNIRKAFIASPGRLLISVDYSQIELRILAALSRDEKLIDAYANDRDLHTFTASRIFQKEETNITREERDKAKIVNFSLIYGKSAFGLAKEINISMQDAKAYIDRYFTEYSKVKEYIDNTIAEAKNKGYVESMFGRKRYLEGINSHNNMLKQASERMAVNSIIQGTQSEIIKIAMVNIYNKIKDATDISMMLQVHDELVFEVEKDRVEYYINYLTQAMSQCVTLDGVPIQVNVAIGENWEVAK